MPLTAPQRVSTSRRPAWCWLISGAFVLALAGCASPDKSRAPLEDRATSGATVPKPPPVRPGRAPSTTPATPGAAGAAGAPPPAGPAAPPGSADPAAKPPPPGIENAGKPGYYSVRPGDTLIRIALDNGQNWRDVARWNGLDNPNLIEVGQVLRVVPPTVDAAAVSARGVATAQVETRPLDPRSGEPRQPTAVVPPASGAGPLPPPGTSPATGAPAAPGVASVVVPVPGVAGPGAASSAASSTGAAAPPPAKDDELPWQWPAAGTLTGSFEEGRTRGLLISGKAGDPVLAAADGRVIYAGSALRGYGNLIIVKHNATYLTAYAHNQALLVKEDQAVRRGQKIAEMGATDAERVQLHFEIRRQGRPVDPLRLLPPR